MATAIAPKKSATAVAAAIEGAILTLAFANGESLQVDANRLTPEIRHAALMHGLKQKLIDAAAIARNPDTGMTATIKDKYDAVVEVFDRITGEAPTWNKARGGEGSGGKGKGGMLATAMMRLTSKSRDDINVYLDGLSKEQIAALRKNPRVVEMIAQIQVETANTNGIDSDELLDGLMGGYGQDVEDTDDDATDEAEAPAAPAPIDDGRARPSRPRTSRDPK